MPRIGCADADHVMRRPSGADCVIASGRFGHLRVQPVGCSVHDRIKLSHSATSISITVRQSWESRMRSSVLFGVLLALMPLEGHAAMIEHPRAKGLPIDHCPLINGAIDCERAMMAATIVCKEHGFRRALTYRLFSTKEPSIRLYLSIDNAETLTATEWKSEGAAIPFAAIDCSQ